MCWTSPGSPQRTRPVRQRVELQSLFQKLELNFEDIATERGATLVIRSTDVVLFTDAAMLRHPGEPDLKRAIKFIEARAGGCPQRGANIAIEVWIKVTASRPKTGPPSSRRSTAAHGERHHGGVGLGLAVVQRFAECLGCEIQPRSQMGHGTVMTLLFRAASSQTQDDRWVTSSRDIGATATLERRRT